MLLKKMKENNIRQTLAKELHKKMEEQKYKESTKHNKVHSTTESENEIGRDHHLDTSGEDLNQF